MNLVLWLSADIVWAIYQLVIDIVPPMPSADYLWLCAYGFLGYYLFSTYKEFQKKFNFGRKVLVASVIGKALSSSSYSKDDSISVRSYWYQNHVV